MIEDIAIVQHIKNTHQKFSTNDRRSIRIVEDIKIGLQMTDTLSVLFNTL